MIEIINKNYVSPEQEKINSVGAEISAYFTANPSVDRITGAFIKTHPAEFPVGSTYTTGEVTDGLLHAIALAAGHDINRA
jgi:hypothetical protein